jgi:hypothetical protein
MGPSSKWYADSLKAWFELHPGYAGVFTRDQAEGAIPNGTRIVKRNSAQSDSQPDGALGVVLGSIKSPAELHASRGVAYCYFVEWDALPRVAVGVVDRKISSTVTRG